MTITFNVPMRLQPQEFVQRPRSLEPIPKAKLHAKQETNVPSFNGVQSQSNKPKRALDHKKNNQNYINIYVCHLKPWQSWQILDFSFISLVEISQNVTISFATTCNLQSFATKFGSIYNYKIKF